MTENTKASIMSTLNAIIFLILYFATDKNIDVVLMAALSILCGCAVAKIK